MKRRTFIKNTAWGAASLPAVTLAACHNTPPQMEESKPEIKISLAQWSLHKAFQGGELNAVDFAPITIDNFDIKAIEYVNQFYMDRGSDEPFWIDMKKRADGAGVESLLIMVDAEGDLGDADPALRKTAVENHFKWVNAAKLLGCHSIRVNAFGKGAREELKQALIDGMGQLVEYAGKEKINVLIENHGLHSSDAAYILDIIKAVGQPNFGTLPDFGNWCTNVEWGSIRNENCTDVYGIYKGVKEFMPYAKGVSAKAYEFDAEGNETSIDFKKMAEIVKAANFDGYIGVEYEGEKLSEMEGIKATKKLIEKAWGVIE
ncbi:MAG: TIM barrel protein [Bacteroidota bacterium]